MLVMIPPHQLPITGTEKTASSTAALMQKETFVGTAYLDFIYFPFVYASHHTQLRNWNSGKCYTSFSYFYGSRFTSLSNPFSGTAMLERNKTMTTPISNAYVSYSDELVFFLATEYRFFK